MIIDLNLQNKDVVVIGGGVEGFRKVKALLGQECNITLITDTINEELSTLIKDNNIKLIQRHLNNANILNELPKPFMVLAATDNKILNKALVKRAKALGSLAYAADDPSISDFIHPAIINIKDTLFIAISTKGASPAMARILRIKVEERLKDIISDDDLALICLTNYARRRAINKIDNLDERKRYLYTIINNSKIKELIKSNKLEDAKEEAMEILERWHES